MVKHYYIQDYLENFRGNAETRTIVSDFMRPSIESSLTRQKKKNWKKPGQIRHKLLQVVNLNRVPKWRFRFKKNYMEVFYIFHALWWSFDVIVAPSSELGSYTHLRTHTTAHINEEVSLATTTATATATPITTNWYYYYGNIFLFFTYAYNIPRYNFWNNEKVVRKEEYYQQHRCCHNVVLI